MRVFTTSNQSRLLYEFGPFHLDPSERLLSRGGEIVTLTPKAFDTLVALVENNGHLLEKDFLLARVWPDTFVDDNTVASNIYALRKALGQSNGERYIETVPKRGYRFVATVRELHLEAGDLLVQRHTSSRILIKEEQHFTAPGTKHDSDNISKPTFGSKTKTVLFASMLVISLTVVAFVWESNRKAARAVIASRDEARVAYLEGRSLWNTRTGADLFKSISYFEKAISKDPGYALGYAGLADAYAFDYGYWRQSEAMANKAIELDGALAEPHATLGFIRMFWQWNWADAEMEFKRAIELDPGYATAHQWYAIWLASQARLQGARAEMQKANELDPSSLSIKADMAQMSYFAHDYDQAIATCKQALDVDPDSINAHNYLYQAYTQRGMYREAVEEFIKFQELTGEGWYNDHANKEMLRKIFATGGITGFWKANLDILERGNDSAYIEAEYYALLGDKAQSLYWLEKSYAWHNFDFLFIKINPDFECLHTEPRYRSLLLRSGLASPDSPK